MLKGFMQFPFLILLYQVFSVMLGLLVVVTVCQQAQNINAAKQIFDNEFFFLSIRVCNKKSML